MKSENNISRKFRFVHVFCIDSVEFNHRVINIVLNTDSYNSCDHLFVTSNKILFNEYKECCNIEYMIDSEWRGIKLVNHFGNEADWIIIHGLPNPQYSVKIDRNLLSRIIWRTWGGDVTVPYHYSSIKDAFKHINWILSGDYKLIYSDIRASILWPGIVKRFYAIGVSGIADELQIEEIYDAHKYYYLPYICDFHYDSRERVYDDYYHIMIEHSGYDRGHCELLDMFKRYEDKNIMLHFVLSYGNKEYINRVIEYIKNTWNGRFEIVKNIKSYEDYLKWFKGIDALILNGKKSYALGTISDALRSGKKIFLNRYGILSKAFEMENLPFQYVDEIQNMTFGEFSSEYKYSIDNESSTLAVPNYDKVVHSFNNMFLELYAARNF